MRNRGAIIGLVLLLLAALAAATPYFAGMKAEAALRADHEIMANELVLPNLTITLDSYQRGYLASEAVTAITFTSGAENTSPLRFELHHHINHFPSLGHGAIASARSELVLPPEMQQVTKPFLKGRAPLTITTYIGLSGEETAILHSPAFTAVLEDGSTLEWQGIEGSGSRSGDANRMTSDLTLPGLRYNSAEGTIAFSDMRYSSDMSRGALAMWYGTAQATLRSLQLGGSGEESVILLNDVRLASAQQERGTATDGSITIELGKSSFGEVTVESALYDMELRNLDTKTVAEIEQAMREADSSGDESQLGLALLDTLPALLQGQPEFNIRNLRFKSTLGNFDGKLHLAFTGEWDEAMTDNPLGILAMITADIEIAISKSLLVSLGQSQMRTTVADMAEMQGEELSDEEIEAMASERASQQLELLAANEYLLERDDRYISKLRFEKGQLTINGKPANEFLGEATP